MKPIDLSFEQREYLFEMLKALFPDRGWHDVGEDNIFTTPTKEVDDVEEFHWYELCVTHLANAVLRKFAHEVGMPQSWTEHIVKQQLMGDKHPIDILYEIWKHPHEHIHEL